MTEQPNKVIRFMIRVSKYHDKEPVLEDISLSYLYSAKIGVVGLNGSNKSSLLRILAGGRDREFNGELILSPGYSVGFLEQEPELDEDKTVREIERAFTPRPSLDTGHGRPQSSGAPKNGS